MPDATVHPTPATVISSSEFVEHLRQILALASRIYEGYTVLTSAASLNITIQPGTAYINGWEVGDTDLDDDTVEALPPSATNHVYIKQNGDFEINQTGVDPAGSLKLWEITTDATGVVGSPIDRRVFDLDIMADVVVDSLRADAEFAAKWLELTHLEPYIRFEDEVTGDIFRLWARDGKIQITNDAGNVVYTDDLANVSIADASTTVKGVSKLSVAPVSATDPIAVGDNDPRNTNARTPLAHAATHRGNGSDPVATVTPDPGGIAGLMSGADKKNLDSLVSGGGGISSAMMLMGG